MSHPRQLARAIVPAHAEKGAWCVVPAVRTITELRRRIIWTPRLVIRIELLFRIRDDRRWTRAFERGVDWRQTPAAGSNQLQPGSQTAFTLLMFIPDTLRSCMVEPDVSTYLQAPSVGQVLTFLKPLIYTCYSPTISLFRVVIQISFAIVFK